ncbi:hypothetical protein [Kaarinaea lacus]
MDDTLIPEGDNLRKAVSWLSEQNTVSSSTVEEASLKFDLTPLEEAFLLRHFVTENADNDG